MLFDYYFMPCCPVIVIGDDNVYALTDAGGRDAVALSALDELAIGRVNSDSVAVVHGCDGALFHKDSVTALVNALDGGIAPEWHKDFGKTR